MRALGSALEMRYGHGHYGLEDDQRSMGYDDYGMGPPPMHPGGYGTMPRLGPGPAMDRRRLRYDSKVLLLLDNFLKSQLQDALDKSCSVFLKSAEVAKTLWTVMWEESTLMHGGFPQRWRGRAWPPWTAY